MEDLGTGLQNPLSAIGRAKRTILLGAWKKCVPFEGWFSRGNKNLIRNCALYLVFWLNNQTMLKKSHDWWEISTTEAEPSVPPRDNRKYVLGVSTKQLTELLSRGQATSQAWYWDCKSYLLHGTGFEDTKRSWKPAEARHHMVGFKSLQRVMEKPWWRRSLSSSGDHPPNPPTVLEMPELGELLVWNGSSLREKLCVLWMWVEEMRLPTPSGAWKIVLLWLSSTSWTLTYRILVLL